MVEGAFDPRQKRWIVKEDIAAESSSAQPSSICPRTKATFPEAYGRVYAEEDAGSEGR